MNNYQSFPPYQHPPGYGCSPRTFNDGNQRSPRGSFGGFGSAPGPSPAFNFSPRHRGYPGNSSPRYTQTPCFGPGPFPRSPSPRKGQFNQSFQGRFSSPNDTNHFRTPNTSHSSGHSGGWGRGNGRKSFSRQFQVIDNRNRSVIKPCFRKDKIASAILKGHLFLKFNTLLAVL